MVSPTTEAKARRLLAAGKVQVLAVGVTDDATLFGVARVKGDSGVYEARYEAADDGARYSCTCLAGQFGNVCAHAFALRVLVEGLEVKR